MANTEIFNKMAHRYESDEKKAFAKLIVNEMKLDYALSLEKTLLDFGCATGLTSSLIASEVKEVVLLDTAKEMLAIANTNLLQQGITNFSLLNLDLENGAEFKQKVDIILVSLVLLHIPNYQELLIKLKQALKPNGIIYIVDFIKNEAVQSDLVHNGFDVVELKEKFKQLGYTKITSRIILEDEKMFMNNKCQVFLMCAKI